MKKVYEQLSTLGINEDNIFEIMHGYTNWLKMKEKRWIPTPCRIVYRGQNDRLIVLPFLITDKMPYVIWGIEIGNTYFCLDNESTMPVSIAAEFDNARRRQPDGMFRESFWLHDFERPLCIPTVAEMRNFARIRSAVAETVKICNRYGHTTDLLTPDTYWVTEEIGADDLQVLQMDEIHCRVLKRRSEKQTCRLQPVMRYNRFKDLVCSTDEYGAPDSKMLKECLRNIQ